MLFILSPSKTQKKSSKQPGNTSQPQFLAEAGILVSQLQKYDSARLAEIMKTSPKLTGEVKKKINDFSIPHTIENAGAALCTFQGEAFSAIKTNEYSADDFAFADTHIRILSGLYGVLKPCDLIQPYRLEMATKLKTRQGASIYEFWGKKITERLNQDLASMKDQTVINCASREYATAVHADRLPGAMITITFKQKKNNSIKTIGIYAKKARGMFINHVINNRITDSDQLSDFHSDGYCFMPELSTPHEIVFLKSLS